MKDVAHDGKAYGEIVVRAPWLTQGYFGNAEASEQLWAGGYLHTQDIANIDATGNLQITDRIKDVIKSGGEWVSSLEIESLISLHPAVSEVAVIGIKDEKWGERPVALVVLKADASGHRGRHQAARSQVQPHRADLEVRGAAGREIHRLAGEDERRQDEQEVAARAVRLTGHEEQAR